VLDKAEFFRVHVKLFYRIISCRTHTHIQTADSAVTWRLHLQEIPNYHVLRDVCIGSCSQSVVAIIVTMRRLCLVYSLYVSHCTFRGKKQLRISYGLGRRQTCRAPRGLYMNIFFWVMCR